MSPRRYSHRGLAPHKFASDRVGQRGATLASLPQYGKQYFLLRRTDRDAALPLRAGAGLTWAEAAALPLCLLTPEMHNRHIVDAAFRAAGFEVQPVIETNSIVTLMLAQEGEVCAVLPGALVALARHHDGLEAAPLRDPDVHTPIGFMFADGTRASRVLTAALALARDAAWLQHGARTAARSWCEIRAPNRPVCRTDWTRRAARGIVAPCKPRSAPTNCAGASSARAG